MNCIAKKLFCAIMLALASIGGVYPQENNFKVFEKACPAFVPLIEEGIINNDIMDLTIEYYLDDFILENRIDTMVLGCTHYPLLMKTIRRKYP